MRRDPAWRWPRTIRESSGASSVWPTWPRWPMGATDRIPSSRALPKGFPVGPRVVGSTGVAAVAGCDTSFVPCQTILRQGPWSRLCESAGPLPLSQPGEDGWTVPMASHPALVGRLAIAVVAGSIALGGCSARQSPRGMMGGGGGGYHYSALTCRAPGTAAGSVVSVRLSDMGMSRAMGAVAPMGAPMRLRVLPATVAAGRVTLVAENVGWRTHELVVLPLDPGASEGERLPGPDGEVDESLSLGEASNGCGPDSGEGLASGTVGWTTVDLEPGRYELVCNLRNHYANGMHQELDIR